MNFHCAWELESRWTPETSKSDCKGQNLSLGRILYIIGNILKRRCPKWVCMTQVMAKRKDGSQIGNLTPNDEKSGIDSIPLYASGVQHANGKFSTGATTSV
jgi:hypothetical protein